MATGEVSLSLDQSVNGYVGNVSLSIDQTVVAIGSVSLQIDQSVNHAIGNVSLLLQQSVSQTGDVSLGLSQNVYDPLLVTDSWVNWDVSIFIDGADKSADLIDRLEIGFERFAARHANFTLLMSGVVNAHQFLNRQVVINYHQNNGAVWRRFTGKIDIARYNSQTKTMHITCTDELQKVIDGHSNDELKALTGAYWSEHVFNADNTGWDYLNDLLKTVNKSVELNSSLQLQINDYQNKIIPDYIFDEDLILDINVDTAELKQLVNRVDIEFKVRHQRLFQRDLKINWTFPLSLCENFSNSVTFPDKSIAVDAIENAARNVLGITYLPIWPSGIYSCLGKQVFFSNSFTEGMRGFYASTRFRWNQTITQTINIGVVSPGSVSEYGSEFIESERAAADIETTLDDWGTDGDDYTVEPAGLVADGSGNHRVDDVDSSSIDNAMETLIAKAVTTVQSSHRKNSVVIKLPLSPFLELDQTIQSDDVEIPCKGVINRITETYDFDSGEPITEIELAISKGGSGMDRADVSISSPGFPELLAGEHEANVINLLTRVGGKDDAEEQTESMIGVFLNVVAPAPGAITYSAGIKVLFDEIDDSNRLNRENEINHEINIAIPDNNLTINA